MTAGQKFLISQLGVYDNIRKIAIAQGPVTLIITIK